MTRNKLLMSLLAAAGLALAFVPSVLALAPWLGVGDALIVCQLLAVLAYLVWIAPDWRRGLRLGLAAGLLLLVVGVFAVSPGEAALGAALVLAVTRSGLLYRSRPARALLLELSLVGGGLLFARLLTGYGLSSMALALWGFFLIQSLFFVVGGVRVREKESASGDAFGRAREQALALMDGPTG